MKTHDKTSKTLSPHYLAVDDFYLMLFVDGVFQETNSLLPKPEQCDFQLNSHKADIPSPHANLLPDNSNATIYDNIMLSIKENQHLDKPILLLYIYSKKSNNTIFHRQHLLNLQKNARAEIVEYHTSTSPTHFYESNAMHAELAENATLHYYHTTENISESEHFSHIEIIQHKNSQAQSCFFPKDNLNMQQSIHVYLNEAHARHEIIAAYSAKQTQQYSQKTFIQHNAEKTQSSQTYRAIADDQATINIHGHIYVAQHAQKTQAELDTRNILLSDKAHVSAEPILEIYADDVQCRHAATVGNLDLEALSYLRMRGIDEAQARNMLCRAFLDIIYEKIPEHITALWHSDASIEVMNEPH